MKFNQDFLEHELIHLVLTLLVVWFLFWRFKDWRLILTAFLFGIFIDLDHWFDFFHYFKLNFNFFDFFDVSSYMLPSGKIYVLLHGWEFIPVFGLVGKILERKLKIKGFMMAAVFSYTLHLFWDNLATSSHPLGYFFIYRLLNNFDIKVFSGF